MMHAKTISILAALVCASQAVAESLDNNQLFKSTRDLFSLASRSDSTSYNPKLAVCGVGSDCSSCGSGYERCSSDDQYIHCYDTSIGATCCADGTGRSCDSGYYCYPAVLSGTLCCPDGIDADTCKSLYGATLTSILPSSTATSAPTVSTSSTSSASSASSTVTSASSSTASASSTAGAMFFASSQSVSGNHATNATATYSNSSATATSTASSSLTSSSSSSSGTSTSGAAQNAASFVALFGAAIMAAML